ncbi:MAG: hypothetical protein KME64_04175 [Scytonematopsis contorta HA4267-MV1]|jgi:hypothetical protein|nr:hypothetical protein [Scytonematopsis contorta HA4267-MV1]
MSELFSQKPAPHKFKEGNASDYEVFVGKAGTWCTRHNASGETIQSVKPGNIDMLNIANLGLNILNLGVGIYNASQLRKVRKKLEHINNELQSGIETIGNKLDRNNEQILSAFNSIDSNLQSIKSALTVQHRTLELLVSNQNSLAAGMSILRKEMHIGFQQIIQEVKDIEALRKREEFETRTFKLLKAYERFIYILPDVTEADQLIEKAEDLEAWLKTQLNRIESGKPERLPLFVALAFSIRAKADAFEAKGGNYTNFAFKDITCLINEICNEVGKFCEGLSLYALAVDMPEILCQYVMLNRSLRKGLELQKETNFEVLFSSDEITWDDGLEDFRKIFESDIENTEFIYGTNPISLNTLADYEWYISFAGEDRLTFKVHSRSAFYIHDILRKMGYPIPSEPSKTKIAKSSLQTLMKFALPEINYKVSNLIQSEFGIDVLPKLIA